MIKVEYRSLIIITTEKDDGKYNHSMRVRDWDNNIKRVGINMPHLSDIKKVIIKDQINYIESNKKRKKATTEISIETKVK